MCKGNGVGDGKGVIKVIMVCSMLCCLTTSEGKAVGEMWGFMHREDKRHDNLENLSQKHSLLKCTHIMTEEIVLENRNGA